MKIRLFIWVVLIGLVTKILIFFSNFADPGVLALSLIKPLWFIDLLAECFLYFLIAKDYRTSYGGNPIAIYVYILASITMSTIILISPSSLSGLFIERIARLLLFIIVAIQLYVTKYRYFNLSEIACNIVLIIAPIIISLSQTANYNLYQIPYIVNILPGIVLLYTLIQQRKKQNQMEDEINALGSNVEN